MTNTSPSTRPPGLIQAVYRYLRPVRAWFGLNLFCITVAAACNLAQALVIQYLIDGAVEGRGSDLPRLVLYVAAVTAIWVAAKYAGGYAAGVCGAGVIRDLNAALGARVATMKPEVMETMRSGDVLSRFSNDLQSFSVFVGNSFAIILYTFVLFLAGLVWALGISWKLALACLVLTPLAFFLTRKLADPLVDLNEGLLAAQAKANDAVQDAAGGMAVIKAFTLEGPLRARFGALADRMTQAGLRVDRRSIALTPVRVVAGDLPEIISALVGCLLVIRGEISLGRLFFFQLLMGYVIGALYRLPDLVAAAKAATAALGRVREVIDAPEERKDGLSFPALGDNALEVKDVRFSYVEGRPVLEGLSFAVPTGATYAIVGPSGSGKTTVVNLLCAYREPQEGSIRLFGQDLRAWSLEAARANMALVSQEPFLLPDTVAANIRCGMDDARQEAVVDAAARADAHEFIQEMPNGYESEVGERGAKLSGGQRQRVALARAILKDTKILLLDEPTSSLDTRSEAVVQAAIDRIRRDRTVVIVAHRLSTIRKADRILVLDRGRIVESGRHEELMAAGGLYSRLYRTQVETPDAGVDA